METRKLTRMDKMFIGVVGIVMSLALLHHEDTKQIFTVMGITFALVFLSLVSSRLPVTSPRAEKLFFSLLIILMLGQLLQTWLG